VHISGHNATCTARTKLYTHL